MEVSYIFGSVWYSLSVVFPSSLILVIPGSLSVVTPPAAIGEISCLRDLAY